MEQKIYFEKIFSGNAIITLKSTKTGDRYTYKIQKRGSVYLVGVLASSDNTGFYAYIGYIKDFRFFYGGIKTKLQPDDKRYLAIKYLIDHPDTPYIEIYHSGRCLKCGKLLTTPESILSGIGPKCANR